MRRRTTRMFLSASSLATLLTLLSVATAFAGQGQGPWPC
jgi:hypothetical protein